MCFFKRVFPLWFNVQKGSCHSTYILLLDAGNVNLNVMNHSSKVNTLKHHAIVSDLKKEKGTCMYV